MRISYILIAGIRCFENSGRIRLSEGCNIFVGQNNAGKSTILRAALALQGFDFTGGDIRPGARSSFFRVGLTDIKPPDSVLGASSGATDLIVERAFAGSPPEEKIGHRMTSGNPIFQVSRPNHGIVPFLAKRKAPAHDQTVSSAVQGAVTGTYQNLVARIDTLATAGHPRHAKFMTAVADIIGIPITTKAAPNGKEAGYYLDDNNFVALERMGDGVTELVAHIVELVLEDRKIFVLEEPESFLHPRALKALLGLIREASKRNQFLIATHSNIVVRELSESAATRVIKVSRASNDVAASSIVEVLPPTALAHREILRELGYEFADFGLHEAWLFLEESSAESIIRDILMPMFAPALIGRLRTFSAAGASNLEPSVGEFTRLVSFVHLQPAYAERMWIRADGDDAGKTAVDALRKRFEYLTEDTCSTFSKPNFECYYPAALLKRLRTLSPSPRKTNDARRKPRLCRRCSIGVARPKTQDLNGKLLQRNRFCCSRKLQIRSSKKNKLNLFHTPSTGRIIQFPRREGFESSETRQRVGAIEREARLASEAGGKVCSPNRQGPRLSEKTTHAAGVTASGSEKPPATEPASTDRDGARATRRCCASNAA